MEEMVINSSNLCPSSFFTVKKTMATNHQSAPGTTAAAVAAGGPRLSGIGSPTLGGGGAGTPGKACKKVLPPAIPMEFLQRRNSQNLRAKDDETPTNAEMMIPQQQQQLQAAQMTTAIVHQQPEGPLIESLDDSALGYYATSNGELKGRFRLLSWSRTPGGYDSFPHAQSAGG